MTAPNTHSPSPVLANRTTLFNRDRFGKTPARPPAGNSAAPVKFAAAMPRGRVLHLATLALLLVGPPWSEAGASPAAPAAATAPSPAPDPNQVNALAQAVLVALEGGNANARLSDLAAKLAFAIDQAQVSCSTSQAALAQVGAMSVSLTPTARRALRNAQRGLSRCSANGTGTAALRGTQSTLAQGTTLGLAGGSSNYQSGQ